MYPYTKYNGVIKIKLCTEKYLCCIFQKCVLYLYNKIIYFLKKMQKCVFYVQNILCCVIIQKLKYNYPYVCNIN